ncbi:hypothetical protein [Staphylococcus kloosii]|jgi:hypothetical protein|uniref:Uncharacterized protein n=1 Tax=Staphylococcus kloosii TaxID=29384 RepID=A0A921H035_9STAP|nr:hypothetical protein [Staphylococcus kloosii]MBF7022208.1 hypothetical protein [Staphylococcus kloosii]MBF7029205.1 hypothetical protein [Staphylococcus kloosii]MCD8878516.1 hypothetical protein [Staphylococcus kloosii]SUM49393.1 Uncharacterised protein [Staphylococcus kloosii]GEP80964.1 hypothetical protein SKL01_01420 [Staphylococcus kloosii]
MKIINLLKETEDIKYTVQTRKGNMFEHRIPIHTPSDQVSKILFLVEQYNDK